MYELTCAVFLYRYVYILYMQIQNSVCIYKCYKPVCRHVESTTCKKISRYYIDFSEILMNHHTCKDGIVALHQASITWALVELFFAFLSVLGLTWETV